MPAANPLPDTAPDASSDIDIAAAPADVYALISDPASLADVAAEYRGHRWLKGATGPSVGAKFVGQNKNGRLRWMTVCTITDAATGERFGFEVSAGPVKIARWQYDIQPTATGCRVTESTWDRRPSWLGVAGRMAMRVPDHAAHNQANIEATLRNLKQRAELG